MKILFVNKDAYYSKNRVEMLQENGFEVIFRQNASEVFEVFGGPKESWPDILVMDNFLPPGNTEQVNASNTLDFIRTGKVIYEIIREKQITTPTLIYTTERDGYEELCELCKNDSRLTVVYECATNSTNTITIMAELKKFAQSLKTPA